MNRGRSYLTSVGLTAAGFTLIAPAVAQEVGGLTASFGIRQTVTASDNLDLRDPAKSGARSVTRLNFGLANTTQTSTLRLNTSGQLEAGSGGTEFSDPAITLSFATSSRNSKLSAEIGYRETDVNALNTVFADTGVPGVDERLVVGTGTRERKQAGLTFETGLDAPLGFTFDFNYVASDFSDTTDPDLFASERLTYGASMRMQLNDTAVLRFGVTQEDYESEDANQTTRDNVSVFLSGDFDIRSDLTATAGLRYSRNETTTTSMVGGSGMTTVESTSTNKGFGGNFSLTKTLKNGTIGASFDSRVRSDGRRHTVRVTRAVALPRGALSLTLGAVKTDTTDPKPLVDVSLEHRLSRGVFELGLGQRVSVNEDDETIINTRLRASFDQEINAVSSWGLSAVLADTDTIDIDDDTRRLDLGLNYRREMTQDWDMVANYTYSTSEKSGETKRSSNTISLSIERAFQFRP